MAQILLVDDDISVRQFLDKALKHAGYEVETCADGEEALQVLQARGSDFDLLLTDIVMPGIDGIKLSRYAKEIYPGLKIMYITGFAATTVVSDESGIDAPVMAKPFHLKDLVDHISKLIAV